MNSRFTELYNAHSIRLTHVTDPARLEVFLSDAYRACLKEMVKNTDPALDLGYVAHCFLYLDALEKQVAQRLFTNHPPVTETSPTVEIFPGNNDWPGKFSKVSSVSIRDPWICCGVTWDSNYCAQCGTPQSDDKRMV